MRKAETAIRVLTPEGSVNYYTDGAVGHVTHKSGSSLLCQEHTQAFRLSDCSTLQTELIAIHQTLHHAREGECDQVMIHSDSRSSLQTLKHVNTNDNATLITFILGHLQWFQQHGRQVTLNWVPSHMGISGNECANEVIKVVLRFREVQVHVTPSLSEK